MAFFGLTDQPTLNSSLGAQIIRCLMTSAATVQDGNTTVWMAELSLVKDGYAEMTANYDERGNQIETAFFDEEGKPVRNNAGIARFEATYDERGNQIAGAKFDEGGKPVRDNDGIASFTAQL